MAAGKKNSIRLGAHLAFLDESGFLLIPTVRKTWSPRGQTPVFRHRQGRRDKVSVISAISASPIRHRLNLYFQLHPKNIQQAEVCDFLRYLLRHLRGPVIVLLDNLSAHGGEPVRALCRKFPRLHLERFPAYAPELNPDEGVWPLAKARLANGCPDTQDELFEQISEAMKAIANSPARLRGCISQTQLSFFEPHVAFILQRTIVSRLVGRNNGLGTGECRVMKIGKRVVVSPPERRELKNRRISSRKVQAEDARRARLILLLARGESHATVCEKLGCSPSFISRWKTRFLKDRLEGLYPRYRGSELTNLTPNLEARILS